MEIKICLDKSVEENAQVYFEESKKAKRKLLGAKRALEETKKKLLRAEKSHSLTLKKEEALSTARLRKKDWFEKFRWFISSDNLLVIGGKDASSNEVVIKRHTDSWNIVFHTEAPGSPFVVVKNSNGEVVPESTIREAAIFAASFSKAWDLGIRSLDVFEVMPSQVSKEAGSGEYISKGSFMIRGERKIHSVSLELAIGFFLKDNAKVIMAGPISAVSSKCKDFVVLKQGSLKKGEVSKKIMSLFNLSFNDDILSALPPGKFDFAKK